MSFSQTKRNAIRTYTSTHTRFLLPYILTVGIQSPVDIALNILVAIKSLNFDSHFHLLSKQQKDNRRTPTLNPESNLTMRWIILLVALLHDPAVAMAEHVRYTSATSKDPLVVEPMVNTNAARNLQNGSVPEYNQEIRGGFEVTEVIPWYVVFADTVICGGALVSLCGKIMLSFTPARQIPHFDLISIQHLHQHHIDSQGHCHYGCPLCQQWFSKFPTHWFTVPVFWGYRGIGYYWTETSFVVWVSH